MATRAIIVVSPQGNRAKTIQSAATTWGELKQEDHMKDVYSSGVEAVVNITKATLQRDDAVLPEGPFSVYLVTKNNKAGVITIGEALYTEIDEAIGSSSIDTEDVDAVLEVVKSTINAFFAGTAVAAPVVNSNGQTAAEAAALAEYKELNIR